MIKIVKETDIGTNGFFSTLLNKFLEAGRFKIQREKVIRPSQVTECVRYQVADILNLPMSDDLNGRIQRIFDNGNYVHKRYLRSYLPKLGIVSKVFDVKSNKFKEFIEVTLVKEEYWLRGSPDAIIINFEEGLPYVFELKSMKAENFYGLTEPDWTYLAQLHLYMFLTNIPRAIIVYENKNNQEIKEFIIKQDDIVLNNLLARIRTIQDHVNSQTLPPCENTLSRKCRCASIKE